MDLPEIIRFDDWTVHRASGELRNNGRRIRLADQALRVLEALLSIPGEVVTREQLIARLWPKGVVVEFDTSLNAAVRKLRAALGDEADTPRYIETLPRKGYRFIGVVASESLPAASPAHMRPQSEFSAKPVAESLAVLPFKPLLPESANPALELGMTDTLIMRLSNLPGVKLSPLSSVRRYAAVTQDPLAAGRELNVAAVLDGSIQTDERRIRLNARLLQVTDGVCLWSRQFDSPMNDIFAVQDAIARQVVDALAVTLSAAQSPLPRQPTYEPSAYQAYVSGLYKWRHRLPEAVADFEAAVRRDPTYALAWSGLANALAAQGEYGYAPPEKVFPIAKEAALKAVELDDALSDAHDALGHVLVQYERRYVEGEERYRRAIQLRENVGETWLRLAIVCAYQSRIEQALAYMRHAQNLEPTRVSFDASVGMMLYFNRAYEDSKAHLEAVLALDPRYDQAHTLLGRCLIETGDFNGALRHFKLRSHPTPGSEGDVGRACARAGRVAEARVEIERLEQRGRQGFAVAYDLASIHAAFGEESQACAALERALHDRSQLVGFLRVDPAFDMIRGLSRFVDIERQLYSSAAS